MIADNDEFTFTKIESEFPELEEYDCLIRVEYCGVSHTDLLASAGTVPGHEVVGIIEDVGLLVKNLEAGTRVGVGWQLSSCHACKFCESNRENLCPDKKSFKDALLGGFGEYIIWDARFVYTIPEEIPSAEIAPLLTAGASVYAPLKELSIMPTSRIGIVGIGGLGHLAIKFAKAWGCYVIAISSSLNKKEEALNFGADEFMTISANRETLESIGQLDAIFSTVSVPIDWNNLLKLLNPYGKFIMLGAVPFPMTVDGNLIINKKISLIGSIAASPECIRSMIEFVAVHNIKAEIELMEMNTENCQTAFQRIGRNLARYRIVLKNLKLDTPDNSVEGDHEIEEEGSSHEDYKDN
ncbi:uncharacterized protein TRIADDRAFT_20670 [Trichoplax adhaerens]|uniref:Enoyl reductase (ER) domain-containing protein n=1 Tax=Trichoplax adhaerens TaxID=10228 RepID=B3RN20_TRIAD|nr:hypothetical protein TRIADDRAFT_20670 [Trichoplax adhaerens]EDV27943.1 hypothetical protein TRIADDRAFT_20670 [Trichoplax adhaerens]|eukprot:XP_002109777.1 hypothetical protein TRIADDRAFT_20670 [Trichoplax adhaerens]